MDNSPVYATAAGWFSTPEKRCRSILPLVLAIVIVTILLSGCQKALERKKATTLNTDSIQDQYISIADSINYGVVVKNRDESDTWQKKSLENFEREAFVDFLFKAVYEGRLQPYDYFSGEPLSLQEVKELEKNKEFNRSRIGKIQFKERWYFDTDHLQMVKQVTSVMLAYEVYREDGSFRGYKPAFLVKLPTKLRK